MEQKAPLGPPPAMMKLYDMMLGFMGTQCLHAIARSGALDQLSDGSKNIAQIAKACGQNQDVLCRLLRWAALNELVILENGLYSATDGGRLLMKDTPGSLSATILLGCSEPWQQSWANLFYSVETGKIAFDHVFGKPFFNYLEEHPEISVPYNNQMTANSMMAAHGVTSFYDFSSFQSVADIGGGQGHLLKAVLAANPHLHGTLFDQESVVGNNLLDDMADRVDVVSGDFFKSVPSADLLMLKTVIHDWSDEDSVRILSNCRAAMGPNSKLLLVEMVVSENPDKMQVFFDLHMLVLLGGKERTEKEFGDLFSRAGLKLNRVIGMPGPLSLVEAIVA